MRVLLAGWFGFDEVVATVGDELGADVVAGWLTDLGIEHDVAWAPCLDRGVDRRDVDPAGYPHLVFVSGPVADRPLLRSSPTPSPAPSAGRSTSRSWRPYGGCSTGCGSATRPGRPVATSPSRVRRPASRWSR